ncbi:MAG TPA: hypothetical protein VLA33_11410 [Gemmatimonadota bacterium]|nr:hypothetical protein [Gemmatimonadota bacterium]
MRDFFRVWMLALVVSALAGCAGDSDGDDQPAAESPAAETASPSTANQGITVEGFSGPESALHDPAADVYLVSNLDGQPAAKDGNGFISRVSPAGEIVELRWIDGASEGVTLNAPKGMALLGDTLLVADIEHVRLFDRVSGAPIGTWAVDGATFLNDVTVSPGGTVYASDTGVRFEGGEREDTGTSGIHAFAADGSRRTVDTSDLTGINGLAAAGNRLYGVSSGSGRIFVIEDGILGDLPELPGLGLDGIVVTDRGLLISDWDTEAVYLLRENGSVSAVVRNVTSPADIGIDRRRDRLLIPGLTTDQLLLAPLGL